MVKYDGPAFFRKKGLKMDDHSVRKPTDSAKRLKSDHPFTPAIQQKLAQTQAPDTEASDLNSTVRSSARLESESTNLVDSRPVRRFRLPISNYELTRRPLPRLNQAKRQLTSRQELNDPVLDESAASDSNTTTSREEQSHSLASAAPGAPETKPVTQSTVPSAKNSAGFRSNN